MKGIKFGTDGWRAIMARDFTYDNLSLVVQAVASYLLEQKRANKIVIGYDQRFLSDKFALEAAEVLAGNGIKALLTYKASPTPTTAFAIKEYHADGALMITASHNPPEYNGIKFIPYYAGPATPEITDGIEEHLNQLDYSDVKRKVKEKAEQVGLIEYIDPMEAYLKHLRSLINWEYINKGSMNIIFDPMFGAGIGYLDDFLVTSTCKVNTIHGICDPLFGGGMPEPMGSSLCELVSRVQEAGAKLGLALDGDADRFGAVDSDGTYFTPNQILAMILHHLIENRGWKGPVARTVATTHLLDKICDYHNLKLYETPVGFKYIGQKLLHNDCILGGEESGGLSIRGHIPEKDGILAILLIIEMVGQSEKTLGQLMEEIYQKYGKMVSERLDLKVPQDEMAQILNSVKEYSPIKINGQPVVERIIVDGTKLKLANGCWVLIRPSGTEPLLRVYVEAGSVEEMLKIQEDVKKDLGL